MNRNIVEQYNQILNNSIVVFANPNPNSSVALTPELNRLSKLYRQNEWYKKHTKSDGFELNYMDFMWEYELRFNHKVGFVIIKEYPTFLQCYVYKYENDLNPAQIKIVNSKSDTKGTMFFKSIKKFYKMLFKDLNYSEHQGGLLELGVKC